MRAIGGPRAPDPYRTRPHALTGRPTVWEKTGRSVGSETLSTPKWLH